MAEYLAQLPARGHLRAVIQTACIETNADGAGRAEVLPYGTAPVTGSLLD